MCEVAVGGGSAIASGPAARAAEIAISLLAVEAICCERCAISRSERRERSDRREGARARLEAHSRSSTSIMLLTLMLATGAALNIGDPAPDFTATSHTGSTVSLKDYSGKKILLWFYPRASTGG